MSEHIPCGKTPELSLEANDPDPDQIDKVRDYLKRELPRRAIPPWEMAATVIDWVDEDAELFFLFSIKLNSPEHNAIEMDFSCGGANAQEIIDEAIETIIGCAKATDEECVDRAHSMMELDIDGREIIPLFSSLREAEKFLEWLADQHRFDPREVDDNTLISLLGFFRSHDCEAIKWTHPYCEPGK